MKYEDVVLDIKKLVGLRLESIRPGAEIIIKEVDQEEDRIILETASGDYKTRPLSEIRRIWHQLCKNPAVHVDKILGGSGSSRNQPETILANLPYIEWLRVDNKKHIAFTGEFTHPYGTLKKMDNLRAYAVKQDLRENLVAAEYSVLFISNNIMEDTKNLENITGLTVSPISPGVYEQENDYTRVLIVAANTLNQPIRLGTYLVVRGKSIPNESTPIQVGNRVLYVTSEGGLNLAVYVDKLVIYPRG